MWKEGYLTRVKALPQNNLLHLMKPKRLQEPIDCVDIFREKNYQNVIFDKVEVLHFRVL